MMNVNTRKISPYETERADEMKNPKTRYIAICVTIIFYEASLEMCYQSVSQYLYYRINADLGSNCSNRTSASDVNSSACGVNNVKNCNEDIIQKESSNWFMYQNNITYGMAFFVSLFLGSLSDTVGRKILLVLPPTGVFFRYCLVAAIIHFRLNLWYFLLASAFEGITGALYTFTLGCYSIASDDTKRDNTRSIGIGLFDIIMGSGLAFSQVIADYLIQDVNVIYPVLIAIGCVVLSLISCIFFIPETMKFRKTIKMKETFSSILYNFKTFKRNAEGKNGKVFIICLAFYGFLIFPSESVISVETLYFLGRPYCWSTVMWGWYGTARNAVYPTVTVLTMKALHNCFPDVILTTIGCMAYITRFLLEGLGNTNDVMYTAAAVGVFGSVANVALKGVMSRTTSATTQGSMFAVLSSLQTVIRLFSGLTFNNLYSQTVHIYPGLTFLVMAGFISVGLILSLCLIYATRQENKDEVLN